jgi:membrane protease YdiL (CAAX protease family)
MEVKMKAQNIIVQILWALLLAVILLGIPRLSGVVADQFDYAALDTDGAFAWLTVHHIVQALAFLLLMIIITRLTGIQFGFGWGDRQAGWAYVRVFVLIFTGYTVVLMLIAILTGGFQPFPYPFTARNISGQLGFQLLLTGPSEELIFRAFAMTMLGLLITGTVVPVETGLGRVITTLFGGKITAVNLIAALIFGLAHVRFSFNPFSATYSIGQVLYSVGLGLFYGVAYERSGSMLYPMIMHSFTNVAMVGATVIATAIIG